MAIHKKCLACNTYRDGCTGKAKACGDWTKIDLDGPVTEAPAVVTTVVAPAVIAKPEPPAENGESRQDKFNRIGAGRQAQVLDAIRKLGHLTSRYERKTTGVTVYTYEWTAEMVEALVKPIEQALATLKAELLVCDNPREHGFIEEK